jgi:hypothetical protein
LLKLIQSISPAVLLDRHKELKGDAAKSEESMNKAIQPYVNYCFKNGVEGERFESDYWKNYMGMFHSWAVSVPEIIENQGTIYLVCRWWNYNCGFSSQSHISSATVQMSDGSTLEGYIVYKQGVGYQSNSQYFVGIDGSLWEYVKQVISHQPVRYLPTGGTNVGSTETIISADLKPAKDESSDLTEMVELLKRSIKTIKTEGLRPIMTNYFTIV